MNRILSLALLSGGIVLVIYGISAADSVGSRFARLYTGAPTDKTLWLLIGGIVAVVIGVVGLLRTSPRRR
jgi:hypothetical protein